MLGRIKAAAKAKAQGKPRPRMSRQRGIALLLVTVTIAVVGATAGEFAYNTQVDLESAANSRDMLRAEYMARSSIQLGQLLVVVQAGIYKQMPAEMRDMIVLTDYAGFLAKVFGGDKEAREGIGGLVGLDLSGVKGLDTPAGTFFDLSMASEEGKYFVNCAGGPSAKPEDKLNLFRLVSNLIRPLRYDRMFNVSDPDGVLITRDELPRAVVDWVDLDLQRYEPLNNGTASEERYDLGKDRYEAHNYFLDTTEEMTLIRGISEDFWGAFGELFSVYGTSDCRVLAGAVSADQWPLIAAMISASSSDPNTVYDPNTALVAQQVAGVLKTGLPLLKQLMTTVKIECKTDARQCTDPNDPPAPKPVVPAAGAPAAAAAQAAKGDSVSILSDLICSDYIAQLPSLSQGLTSMLGSEAPPPPTTPLRAIKMCPGRLGKYLREKPSDGGNPRRFYRIDATGVVQRNAAKSTQVHIRGVWDAQGSNNNPLCTNHPSCLKGTWVYFRMD